MQQGFRTLVLAGALLAMVVPTRVFAQVPFTDELVVSGLSLPTAFIFLPDGRALIAQKNGVVRMLKNGALQTAPFIDLRTRVNDYWDRGLVGIAADPAFATNGYVYLYYVFEHNAADYSGAKTARLTRVTAVGDTAALSSEVVLLGSQSGPGCAGLPAGADCIPADSPSHNGGTLKFAADGSLFVGIGDGASFQVVDDLALRAQNLDSLAGKILRITPAGLGRPANPFWNGSASSIRSKIWAYGVRNPFKGAPQPGTGQLFVGDVGWSADQEINIARPGTNLGWPCYEGANQQPAYASKQTCQTLYAAGTAAVQPPLVLWPHNGTEAAALGGFFYTASAFPAEFQSSYFFGDYAQGILHHMKVDAAGTVTAGPTIFATGLHGPVDLQVGADGNLYYVAITTSELRRIRYLPSGAPQPISGLTWTSATNAWGPVERDMSNGEDAAGDGRTLTLNGQTYARGLGVHASSDVRYALNGACTLFQSDVGVDDESGSAGSIVFQVWTDGVQVYDSGVMTGQTATAEVMVDLTGKKELSLRVTDAGDGNAFDHGDWAGATITCGSETGNLFGPARSFAAGNNTHSVAIADLNDDHRADLVAANTMSNTASVWLGNGNGTFLPRTDVGTGVTPKSVSIGDVNGDGRLDLVSANQDVATISVLPGNGAGAFGTKTDYPALIGSHETALGDFNKDGRLDVIVAGFGGDTVGVLLRTAGGGFAPKVDYTVGPGATSVIVGDFNRDLFLDAAVANNRASDISVLLGRGDGTFNPQVRYVVGAAPHSIRSGDVDGDNLIDLVTANEGSNTVSVLHGRGDGTFATAVHHPVGSVPKGVAIADVDGNGAADILAANTAGNYPTCCFPGGDTITVLPGIGGGAFGIQQTYTVGLTPFAIATGDIDGDGDLDVATANWHSNNVTVLENLGSGTLPPPQIGGVSAANITSSSATITWTTDVAANSQVEYGTTTAYGSQSAVDPTPTTVHQVALTGLTPATLYHYRVRSRDANGTLAASNDFSFTTTGAGGGDTQYVSDLTWTSMTNGWGPAERDRSNGEQGATDGLALTLNGVVYPKGLGVHAPADVRYVIPSGCTQFAADIGVDDEVGPAGSVVFEVWLGATRVFQSAALQGTTAPVSILVDVSGPELRLMVTDAGNGNGSDHGDWASARFLCGGTSGPPPQISAVSAGNLTSSGATVLWTTDVAADSQVEYGTTTAYGSQSAVDPTLTTGHQVGLTGLTPATLYHYRVRSRAGNGTLALSNDFTFTTTAAGSGDVQYVSDLTWTSMTNGWGPAERDRSNGEQGATDGLALTLNGVVYPKGLGVHAPSDVRYVIPSGCTQFAADIGVDDEVGPAGSMVFEAWLGATRVFQSAALQGTTAPVPVLVDVSGPELRLMVTDAGNGNGSDHGDWANARFLCSGTSGPPPQISAVSAGNLTSSGATILWTTDVAADSQVEYGTTTAYGSQSAVDPTLTTGHQVGLTGLTPATLYHYRVRSRAGNGTLALSNDFSFTTTGAGGGDAQYVSDLTWTSMTNGWGPAERDRSNGEQGATDGLALTLNGVVYPKGLGVHAPSDVRYVIPSGCTQFAADIGVDDEVGPAGSVVFEVWLGATRVFQSAALQGTTAPVPVLVDVSGPELRLVVTDAGNGNGSDHGDWANARFFCHSTANAPPVPSIAAPNASLTYKVGDVITFGGSATDTEDGTLSPSALSWAINIQHCPGGTCHLHSLTTATGAGGTFTVPDHGDESSFEIILTATDSAGATATVSRMINPQTVQVTLNTSPTGRTVIYGGVTATAPMTRTSIVGSAQTISTPSPQNGLAFSSWSDGGAQSHNIKVGTSNMTLTAAFGSAPPVPSIQAPAASLTYKVGDVITFAGSAADPEDGSLPPSALSWVINIRHCPGGTCHTHLHTTATGAGGSFTVPDHGDESSFEIILTATDSTGATATVSRMVNPQTVQVTLNTSPTGLTVVYGGVTATAPMTRTSIVGSAQTISTASPQNGLTFTAWSDGGARTHNIKVGTSNMAFAATFADQTAPVISGVSATTTSSSATIRWTTSEPADTQVQFGLTSSYGSTTPLNSTLTASHTVTVTGLGAQTTYHYRLRSRDAAGNLRVSGDFTFRTKQ